MGANFGNCSPTGGATVHAAETLPLSVEQITPQWLSSVLGPDITATNLEITHIVWGTATKVLLRVDYVGNGHRFPERMCVKGGFVPELRTIMTPGYQAEARFYRDIAPTMDKGLPRCWYADADEQQGIVILDDLTTAGARFCDAREPLAVDHAATAVELLASYHTRTDIAAPWLATTPHFRPMVAGLLTAEHWDHYIGQTSHGPVLEVMADRDQIIRAFHAVWADEDSRPHTLIHGDANLTNVYLDTADAPRFLDWQFVCRGDPYHDVALFLIGALSIDDRRAHEQALLRTYLQARGDEAESFDDAWVAYRRHTLHGATYALTPEQMQPAEVRAALAERFAQAALDLDTLALLDV